MMTRKIKHKILPESLPIGLLLAAIMVSTSLSGDAWAEKKSSPSTVAKNSEASVSRIKELTYNESDVYVIRTKYGYQTNIVFDPKEEIETMSVGDRSLWQLIPTGNRLYIRPMADNLSTNMTLITNKHSYEFDLKSVDSKSDSNAYVIRFTYPEDVSQPAEKMTRSMDSGSDKAGSSPAETASVDTSGPYNVLKLPQSYTPEPAAPEPAQNTTPSANDHNNYNYTYSGLDSLAPLQVYDDGHSTFIRYQSIPKSIPSALVIGGSGAESPAPSILKGNTLIIDGVVGEIALRSESGEIRIYNEVINPR